MVQSKNDVLQVGVGIDQPDAPHDKFHSILLDHLAADVQIALAHGVHDHLQRYIPRAHPQRRNLYLVLPHKAADACDFSDTGNGVELITHEPILNCAQAAKVVTALRCEFRVNLEVILINPAEAGRVRAELRFDAGGQNIAKIIQPLKDARPREIIVNLVIKNDGDEREAEHGVGADGFYAGQPLQIHRERIGALVLHFLRAAPRPVRENDNLVLTQVGNRVHRRLISGADAETDEQRHAAKDQETVAQRPFDDAIDHDNGG